MHIPAVTPNIVIIAVLLAAGVYGGLVGKHRLRIFILSVYVGIVLADQMTAVVRPYAHGLGEDQLGWLLLGLPIVIFGCFPQHHGHGERGSVIANLIVGVLAGALILSSALYALPTSELSAINGDSYFALWLSQFHLWLLGLLPIIVLVFGLFGGHKKGHR